MCERTPYRKHCLSCGTLMSHGYTTEQCSEVKKSGGKIGSCAKGLVQIHIAKGSYDGRCNMKPQCMDPK